MKKFKMLALGSLLWSSDMNHHEISASEPSSLHQDSHSSQVFFPF